MLRWLLALPVLLCSCAAHLPPAGSVEGNALRLRDYAVRTDRAFQACRAAATDLAGTPRYEDPGKGVVSFSTEIEKSGMKYHHTYDALVSATPDSLSSVALLIRCTNCGGHDEWGVSPADYRAFFASLDAKLGPPRPRFPDPEAMGQELTLLRRVAQADTTASPEGRQAELMGSSGFGRDFFLDRSVAKLERHDNSSRTAIAFVSLGMAVGGTLAWRNAREAELDARYQAPWAVISIAGLLAFVTAL